MTTADLLALLDAHTEAWRKVARFNHYGSQGGLTAAEHHAQDTYNALAAALVAVGDREGVES